VEIGEDFRKGEVIISKGQRVRPQEAGLLAALGRDTVRVRRKPVIAIISTGDEVVPVNKVPGTGQIRDVNTHTLQSLIRRAGAVPAPMGIVPDDRDRLFEVCSRALADSDMVLISGGSSVGARDFTIEVLSALPDSEILVHGISISPGKPAILAKVGTKAFWGLPGHVVSAMIVFLIVVRPFVAHIRGRGHERVFRIPARLSRNVPSAQGRTDFVRVRLEEKDGELYAEPILGKSGLIRTMIKADGLIEIGMNTEGLDRDAEVSVMLL
jgi:molybdopterin molybdotransferase